MGAATRSDASPSPADGDLFAEIAHRDIVVQHPYDSFSDERRGVRARSGQGPERRGHAEDDRLPHEPRLGARACADRGRRRTASRACCVVELKARFDERRNIEWARSLEQAGRARRLRLPGHEDPRQGDARRAARRRRTCGATCTSAPGTTTRRPRGSTRTSGSSPPTRTSPPTSPTSSTSSPASGGRSSSARSSWRRSTFAAGSIELHPRGRRSRGGG